MTKKTMNATNATNATNEPAAPNGPAASSGWRTVDAWTDRRGKPTHIYPEPEDQPDASRKLVRVTFGPEAADDLSGIASWVMPRRTTCGYRPMYWSYGVEFAADGAVIATVDVERPERRPGEISQTGQTGQFWADYLIGVSEHGPFGMRKIEVRPVV